MLVCAPAGAAAPATANVMRAATAAMETRFLTMSPLPLHGAGRTPCQADPPSWTLRARNRKRFRELSIGDGRRCVRFQPKLPAGCFDPPSPRVPHGHRHPDLLENADECPNAAGRAGEGGAAPRGVQRD